MLKRTMRDFDLQPAGDIDLPPGQRRGTARRESGHLDSLAHCVGGLAARTYLRMRHRLRVEGREHLPAQPPFVMVANHGSHLDTAVLGSVLPMRLHDKTYPLAAGDTFFESPVRAVAATALTNALPVRRSAGDRHALDGLRHRLVDERCAYLVYPEGTRAAGQQLTPFKAGVGLLVAGSSVPVVPCYIDGAAAALPRGRWLPRRVPIRVCLGPPIQFSETPNDRAGWHEVARRLHAAVQRLADPGEGGAATTDNPPAE